MATLTVTATHNFTGEVLTNIDAIVFNTAALSVATFSSSQFGAGLIANNVAITGDGFVNQILVNMSAAGTFSAAPWTFSNWSSNDAVVITGTSGVDTLVGSSQLNTIEGGAGADVLTGGSGTDTFNYITAGAIVAGETINGAGGNDAISVGNSLSYDFSTATISSVERLVFGSGSSTAILAGAQIGTGAIGLVQGSGNADTLVVDGQSVDLSGLAFSFWTSGTDTVTINGTNAGPNTMIGSSQDDAINGGDPTDDLIIGGGGADIMNGGSGGDTFRYVAGSDAVAGEQVNGQGGVTDTIELVNTAAIDFRSVTLSSIERLVFASGNSGAEFSANFSFGFVIGGAGTDIISIATSTVDLSGVAFSSWTPGIDVIDISGNAGVNSLTGSSQDDEFIGGTGADTLSGLGGNDIFAYTTGVDLAGESVDGGTGTDGLRLLVAGNYDFSSTTLTSIEKLTFDDQNITATFNSAQVGGSAITQVVGDNNTENIIVNAGGVTADLSALTFTSWTGGTDTITIIGTAGINDLIGTSQNDIIDGRGSADTMTGGLGDDQYFVGTITDLVVEAAGGGSDRVLASVSYTLGAGQELEKLTTTDNGAITAINLTGNEFANTIFGNAGANTLDGAGGADTLIGFGGDDFYFVDSVFDVVVEGAGEGTGDRIFTSVSYTLGAGVQVEKLSTTDNAGTTGFKLLGNELANVIFGNAGPNRLDGKGGADTLVGLGGDDSYFVDDALDTVSEGAGEGANDQAFASVSYTLGAGVQVERLSTDSTPGTAAINLTGNEFANTVIGNAGANTLDGKGAADAMFGGKGDDFYFVDNASDQVFEAAGEGADRVFASVSYTLAGSQEVEKLTTDNNGATITINLTGNELGNIIFGNAGTNQLDGAGGADTMVGLGGNDTYFVDNAGDVVSEGAGEGINDTVFASGNYTLGAGVQVENFAVTAGVSAATPINLTGNEFAQTLQGHNGANTLDGKGGADIMQGLAGDDLYFVDNAGDQVFEVGGGGTDRVFASVDYALAAFQQVETLSTDSTPGTAPITLIGNELANNVFGNAGSNALKGLAGNDLLFGGGGSDAFVFNTALDAATNVDSILDFTPPEDDIILSSAFFSGIAPGTLAAADFVIGAAAADASDRIIYNNATGALFYDTDGTGGAAQIQFAALTAGLAVTNADFIVV